MTPRAMLSRLAAMDREELRFRTTRAARQSADRVRFAVARPAWRRGDLFRLLDPDSGPAVREAREAARHGDFHEAHHLLAGHFANRVPRWPLAAVSRATLSSAIRERYPAAAGEARDRADRIVEGRFGLLGFDELLLGNPPDWHCDVVHERRAPRGFWASVPFLCPDTGDHKIVWEVNRHQHFTVLGAAWWLTGRSRYRDTFIDHLENWLDANPPHDGINWASMLELAFRALSWTYAIELFSANASLDARPWLVDLLIALDRQLGHIERNLSTYFSPNTHLSGEALGLYAVSLALPELRRSGARLRHGRDVLLREARAQVRDDGGHAELSSHYHRYSTDFYLLALLAARRTGDEAAPALERAVRAQAAYLRTIADHRGCLAHVGDDDGGQLFRFGDAPSADASVTLSALAAALDDPALAVTPAVPEVSWILGEPPREAADTTPPASWPSRLLESTGYFVSRSQRGHLIFDAGPHGFLNGGHAHADALSVVLSAGGRPLFVDPGTATYATDASVRDRFRSPAMHNTVTVDGRGFAEPRGPFHWARSTDARMLVARTGADGDFAVGLHGGYGFPHARAVMALPSAGWFIVDFLSPDHAVTIDAWWHLHPAWSATLVDGGFALTHASGAAAALATTATTRSVEPAPYSPEYGRIDPALALRTTVRAAEPIVIAAFVPIDAAPGACPSLSIAAGGRRDRDRWTSCTVIAASETSDIQLIVARPCDLRALPDPLDWPQPCIQELRASCVE